MRLFPLFLLVTSAICVLLGLARLRPIKKTLLLAALSLLSFAIVAFFDLALSAGSNIQSGTGMALLFELFALPMFFPPLVGFGFLLRWVAERLLGHPIPRRNAVPWCLPTVAAIIGIASVLRQRLPGTAYHDWVSDKMPTSISNFQNWWQVLPGDTIFIVSFKINPSEFDQVLTRHQFQETTDSAQIQHQLLDYWDEKGSPRGLGLHIFLPNSPLVHLYSYSETDSNSQPHMMYVLTNQPRDTVLVIGDN